MRNTRSKSVLAEIQDDLQYSILIRDGGKDHHIVVSGVWTRDMSISGGLAKVDRMLTNPTHKLGHPICIQN